MCPQTSNEVICECIAGIPLEHCVVFGKKDAGKPHTLPFWLLSPLFFGGSILLHFTSFHISLKHLKKA